MNPFQFFVLAFAQLGILLLGLVLVVVSPLLMIYRLVSGNDPMIAIENTVFSAAQQLRRKMKVKVKTRNIN